MFSVNCSGLVLFSKGAYSFLKINLKSGARQKMVFLVLHIISYNLCLILCMQNILEKYYVFPCQTVLRIHKNVLTILLTKRRLSVCDVMNLTVIFKFQNSIS